MSAELKAQVEALARAGAWDALREVARAAVEALAAEGQRRLTDRSAVEELRAYHPKAARDADVVPVGLAPSPRAPDTSYAVGAAPGKLQVLAAWDDAPYENAVAAFAGFKAVRAGPVEYALDLQVTRPDAARLLLDGLRRAFPALVPG